MATLLLGKGRDPNPYLGALRFDGSCTPEPKAGANPNVVERGWVCRAGLGAIAGITVSTNTSYNHYYSTVPPLQLEETDSPTGVTATSVLTCEVDWAAGIELASNQRYSGEIVRSVPAT